VRLWVAAVCGLCLCTLCTPLAMRLATKLSLVDRPGPLKAQSRPVPYLGGVAVFAALVPAMALSRPWTAAPLGGALLLGVADDRAELSPAWRLAGQLVVGGGIAAVIPVRLAVPFGWLATVAVTMVLMNGVNMLDGLDALAPGSMAVAALGAAILSGGTGRVLALGMTGALAGFLLYNRPPARIYLGDGGAYLIGAWLSVTLACSWAPHVDNAISVAMLLLAAIPGAEVLFAVIRRVRAGHSLVGGDRSHPYDLLVARGWGTTRPMLAYVGTQSVLCLAAVLAGRLHSLAGAMSAVGAGAFVLLALAGACGAFRVPGAVGQ